MITLALAGFALLFLLLFAGVPVALGMALVGFVGTALLIGFEPAASRVGQTAIDVMMNYTFSVVALFLLMGTLISRAGLSEALYSASYAFVGHRRGGLAMATVMACGGFSSVCGSSLATAATMAPIAMPSMRRHGYADGLAAGSIAAGGTLGILIPPSIILVIYGNITETDIGKLFVAGIVPGILGIILYIAAVAAVCATNPAAGPPGERTAWRDRLAALGRVWGILALFALVMGGIYFGVFTPTEAGGIGAGGALLFALSRRALSAADLFAVLADTAETTASLLLLIVGATIFGVFMNLVGMPNLLADLVSTMDVAPLIVIFTILAIYIVLGCILEVFSMLLLTVPLLAPLIQQLGFDLVWFGIIVVVVMEVGVITPPIGMNVFILKSVIDDVETSTVFRGVAPFVVADILRLAILASVPGIVLFLPGFMT